MATSRRSTAASAVHANASAFPVAEGEEPWTEEEVEEVRQELLADIKRMERAIEVAEAGLADLFVATMKGAYA